MSEPRRRGSADPKSAKASAKTSTNSTQGGGAMPDDLSFEHALERLEAIVERLEGGELELEASLAAFEEGVSLSRHCAEQLAGAERRIELLVRDGDRWTAQPFDPPDAAEESD